MAQQERAWTMAMREHLEAHEGEWLIKADVLKIGAAEVPDDVAEHEMRNRQGKLTRERVLAAGRQSKALQGLMGLGRFGKLKQSPDKRQVQWLGKDAYSLGEVGRLVDELRARVEVLEGAQDSQQKQLDRLDVDPESRTDMLEEVGLG